jgi:hypothetical protein
MALNMPAALPVRKWAPQQRTIGLIAAIVSRMSAWQRFRPLRSRIFSRSRFLGSLAGPALEVIAADAALQEPTRPTGGRDQERSLAVRQPPEDPPIHRHSLLRRDDPSSLGRRHHADDRPVRVDSQSYGSWVVRVEGGTNTSWSFVESGGPLPERDST